MTQKSCKDELGVSPSQIFPEEEDPGSRSQQPQATSSRSSKALRNLDFSRGPLVNLEYLPFFRTYGKLLAEELALQPEVCRDRGEDWSGREASFWEDPEPPGGFFPYYHSKEETLPSLSCGGSHEVRAGCLCRTVSSGSSAASADPDLTSGSSPTCCPVLHSCDSGLGGLPSSDAVFSGHASGIVPYYRTPEEGLHTGLGPPASPLGAKKPQRSCPGLAQPYCGGTEAGDSSRSHQSMGPQLVSEGEGGRGEGSQSTVCPGTTVFRPVFPCLSVYGLQSWQEEP